MKNEEYSIYDLLKDIEIDTRKQDEKHIQELCSELEISNDEVIQENAFVFTDKEVYGEISNVTQYIDFNQTISKATIKGIYEVLKGSSITDIEPIAGPGAARIDNFTKQINIRIEAENKKDGKNRALYKHSKFRDWFNYAQKYRSNSQENDWVKKTAWCWLTHKSKPGMKIYAEVHWVQDLVTNKVYDKKIKSWAETDKRDDFTGLPVQKIEEEWISISGNQQPTTTPSTNTGNKTTIPSKEQQPKHPVFDQLKQFRQPIKEETQTPNTNQASINNTGNKTTAPVIINNKQPSVSNNTQAEQQRSTRLSNK